MAMAMQETTKVLLKERWFETSKNRTFLGFFKWQEIIKTEKLDNEIHIFIDKEKELDKTHIFVNGIRYFSK